MRTKISSVFILIQLSCFLSAFGQKEDLILTREQNSKWVDSLKKLPFELQLITLKQRILNDTNVFVRQFYNDRIKVVDSLGDRVYGDGKPTITIGGYPLIIDNVTQTNQIISLTKLLTENYIKELNILDPNDPATVAIFGSAGMSGVIIITLRKKKYLRKFKRMKF